MKIFHIVTLEVWENFKDKDTYEAESLRTEGFIHCSFAWQLKPVLQRYYSDAERVLILEIETEKLTSKFIEEPSTNNEIYPHIYGAINREAIIRIEENSK